MLKCSHILYKVDNIKNTVERLTQMGFTVHWGSKPEKANNAFLWFTEGPFIEFFQMPRFAKPLSIPLSLFKGNAAGKRWLKWANSPEGWCDIALEPTNDRQGSDLADIREILSDKGIKSSVIINGKRIRPDGQIVRYNFMATIPGSLPFIVSQHTPPQRPQAITHENGASGVAHVCLYLPPEDARIYRLLCDQDPWIKVHTASHPQITEVAFKGVNNSNPGSFFNRNKKTTYADQRN